MTLFYREFGNESGDVLAVLHGLLGSGENWNGPAKKLSRSFNVVTLDLRNHGRSFHAAKMDYPTMAEDVYETLSSLRPGPWRVLGHSMGGKVAMKLALSRPESVEKLIVLDIAPFRYKPIYGNLFAHLQQIDPSTIRSRGDADIKLQPYVRDRRVRHFLLKNLVRNPDGSYSWRVNIDALKENYRNIWAGIEDERRYDGPTLFIEGERSEAGISGRFDEIRQWFPNAVLERIPKAGHWVHSENPEAFLSAVTRFLDG